MRESARPPALEQNHAHRISFAVGTAVCAEAQKRPRVSSAGFALAWGSFRFTVALDRNTGVPTRSESCGLLPRLPCGRDRRDRFRSFEPNAS